MTTFITVVGHNGDHGALHRAGRRFVNGVRHRFEVVANVPTVVKVREKGTNVLKDSDGPPDPKGPFESDGSSSMEKICQAGYDLLKGDGRISIFGGDELGQEASTVVVAALRKQLADALAELSDAKVRITELEDAAKDVGPKAKGGKAKE